MEKYDRYKGTTQESNYLYWANWYNDYLGQIAQYQGSDYYDRLAANPYAQFSEYQPGALQKLNDWLGGTDGSTAFYGDRQTNANEYVAGILSEMQQNSRNSTVAQVARDQAAGLNDTLSGSVANGTPAAVPQDDAVPPAPGPDGTDTGEAIGAAVSLGSACVGFVQGIMGMFQGMQQLGINAVQKSAGIASLSDSVYNFVLREEVNNLGLPGKNDAGEYDFSSVPTTVLDAARNRGRASPFGDRKADRLYNHLRGTILYNKDGKPSTALERAWRESVASSVGSTVEAAKGMSMPGFDFDDFTGFAGKLGETLTNYEIEATQLRTKILRLEQQMTAIQAKLAPKQALAAGAQADYEADYYSNLSGEQQAGADNAEAQMRRVMAQHQKFVENYYAAQAKVKSDLMDIVKGQGRWYNNLGVMFLPTLFNAVDEVTELPHTAADFITTARLKGVPAAKAVKVSK